MHTFLSRPKWVSSAATATQVDEWLGTYPAARTRKAYRSDLAVFYGWAVRRGMATSNPVDLVDSIRAPKSLPRPVAAELVPGLIAAATDYDVRLMCALAAWCGLRVSEIAALCSDDVNLAGRPPTLVVREGKGRKDRVVPIPAAVHALLVARRRRGGPIIGRTPGTVGRRIAQHLVACGVHATAHQLRHSYWTEGARVLAGNVVALARLMGHESMDTTLGYIGWSGGDVASRLEDLYPAA